MPHFRKVVLLVAILLAGCGGGGGGGSENTGSEVLAQPFYATPNFLVGLAYAPNGDLFFTELQTGNVRLLPRGQAEPLARPVITLAVPPGVQGLLGIAVDPDFDDTGWIYIYETTPGPVRNRVVRARVVDGVGQEATVLIDNIPSGGHDGGKFAFDRENHLYVTTGDAGDPAISQDLSSLGGKVLRLNRDGSIPSDNPFPGSAVFALGFRNVFGISRFPGSDTLFVSENGPECDDEINRLVAGGNYGWRPDHVCGETDPRFVAPAHRITPSAGITGAIFYNGDLFPEIRGQLLVAGFNAGEIRRLKIDENGTVLEEGIFFAGGAGSINDLAESPDGEIVFSTSNTIGRLTRAPESQE